MGGLQENVELITKCYGDEVFSFPPHVWDAIIGNVRKGVVGWIDANRRQLGRGEYSALLSECKRILSDLKAED